VRLGRARAQRQQARGALARAHLLQRLNRQRRLAGCPAAYLPPPSYLHYAAHGSHDTQLGLLSMAADAC
jgi:hypothetical protein